MAQDRIATELPGIVACANERGLKLQGAEQWLNVSRYAEGVVIPPVGSSVLLGLDKAGFIREIAATEPAPTAEPVAQLGCTDREVRITRLAVLNTAVAALNGRGAGGTDEEILALAAKLEAWVGR